MAESSSATSESTVIIAVSVGEHQQFGCPYCGYRSGSSMMSGQGAAIWNCGECDKTSVVLADGLGESPFGFGSGSHESIYPVLQDHPRRGTPSHGRPDAQPDEGGEFFRSRGIGLEWELACFVCGVKDRQAREYDPHAKGYGLLNNIAAFVQNMDSGERVVAMFDQFHHGARMVYRDYEPDRVQVKVGACDRHNDNLQALELACRDGRITLERIQAAAV